MLESRQALRRSQPGRETLAQVSHSQIVVHRFFGIVAAGRFDQLDSLMVPVVEVRVVGGDDGDWDGKGPTALRRLADELAADDALAGRQLRSDVFPAVPIFVIVASYEQPDGGRADRAFGLTIFGELIERVVYYRFPLT